MFDIITIGAATRDVFLLSDQFQLLRSEKFSTGIGECVALGTKIEVNSVVHTTGGGATNAAVTFARLGFRVATVCRVGDDEPAEAIVENLNRERVSTHLVRRVRNGITGYSTLLTAKNGERTALVYRGVSSNFAIADAPLSRLNAKWIYLTSLGGNVALASKLIRAAAAKGIRVAWNPGSAEIKKGLRMFAPLLPFLSVFNMNKEEAEALTERKQIEDILSSCSVPGGITIVTDGQRGAYAQAGGQTVFSGTRGIKSVSRTGAGDAFGSGFVANFMRTGDVKTSLAMATINAESVIQHVGAKAGVLKKWPNAALVKKIPRE